MLWIYGHYKYFYSYSTKIDFSRRNLRPQQINCMDDGFAARFYRDRIFLLEIISPLPFCLETPIFYPPKNHVTFLSLKKKFSSARPIFAGNQFFWKKKLSLVHSLHFLGKSKIKRKKKIRSLAPFFSAENPSSIKLIWCGLNSTYVRFWRLKSIPAL